MPTRTLLVMLGFALSVSTISSAQTHHVASRNPVRGSSREFAAERVAPPTGPKAPASVSPAANPWMLQATIPGAVIHDISFPNTKTGYAAAELGQVWKTTDGGTTWEEVLNLNFPYYWYGIKALSANTVVVSGFNDSNFEGVLRWTTDGGATWSSDVILTTAGWDFRVRFIDADHGLVIDGLNLNAANSAHYTSDGGLAATDWT